MLEIHYREIKDGTIVILRCFGNGDSVVLPDEIHGKTVTKIGDYAFSAHKKKEEEADVYQAEKEIFSGEEAEMFCGHKVREVFLPRWTTEIGKYAFYGCVNLETLGFSDALARTGTGIFTGCKLKKVVLSLYHGSHSALRDIVQNTRFLFEADIRYMEIGQEAHLIFPEYYEEAVENTPARIIENHFHGTGYTYRQCFFRGEIDYRKYDDLFPVAAVQEEPEIVWKILTGRMLKPLGMSEYSWMQYEGYIKKYQREMIKYLKPEDRMAFLHLCGENNFFSREGIEAAISWASEKKDTEVLSFLMDEQRKRFPKKKKTFDL